MAGRRKYSNELEKPFVYDPQFDGPLKHRSCTDIICLLLFVIFICAWLAVGLYAFIDGNPEVLLNPTDSNGARCGLHPHVRDRPNLLFFNLAKCAGPNVPFTGCQTPQVCVKKCPDKPFSHTNIDLSDCICVDGVKPTTVKECEDYIKNEQCAKFYFNSTSVLHRCLPISISISIDDQSTDEILDGIKNIKLLSYAEQAGHDIVKDIKASWKEVIGAILIGIVFCVLYIMMMRWIAGIMVWLSIIGVLALLAACVYFTATAYLYYKEHPEDYKNAEAYLDSYLRMQETWLVLLIISSIILAILFLVIVFLRKRIYLAVALIKEGSKAITAATSSLCFPILPWLLQIVVIIYFIALALYLATIESPNYKLNNFTISECMCTGEAESYSDGGICDPDIFKQSCHLPTTTNACEKATCSFTGMNYPPIVAYMHALNIIGFFWGVCFFSAFGQMVLAATFATWYWTKPKKNVPFFSVTAALLRTLRYHIGTLAFGSLIIAICKMIRVMLEYIDHKLKKYENPITNAIMCCMKCFFWCLEKFLKFINKNAYIMCAIHGKNFCLSAKDAFSLLMRNIIRVFVLDKVTDFLFFLSKLLVTLAVAGITWCIIYYGTKENYTYFYIPIVFVAVCTYLISTMFFDVYSMAVDTLFMCYLEDCERNDGSPEKPYFMSKELGKIFGKKNKKH